MNRLSVLREKLVKEIGGVDFCVRTGKHGMAV